MKRKTNLFYTTGPDSKFLTFSNYGESLTGNFLSVNTKIFPSRLLCMSIKNLNATTKQAFIRYLVGYYENKLAILRDNVNEKEPNISPLAYLLEALSKILFYDETNDSYKILLDDNQTDLLINNEYSISNLTNLNIYSSEITEQDYNGIYSDIICTIDLASINKCNITYNNNSYIVKPIECNLDSIYGWEGYIDNIEGYNGLKPIYDNNEDKSYYLNSNIESLILTKPDQSLSSIEFNIIIPLYEVVNIDYTSNDTVLGYDEYDHTNNSYIININGANKYTHNVPLGIWINAEADDDTNVIVYKDNTTGYSPVWSLMISSQFKPFPYSSKYEIENNGNEITSKQAAFSTFTQVLTRLNKILDNFDTINKRLTSYENRLNEIQSIVKNIGTLESIDNVNSKMSIIEKDIKNEIATFKSEVNETLENIKWKFQ